MVVEYKKKCLWHLLYPERKLEGCIYCQGAGESMEAIYLESDNDNINNPANDRIGSNDEIDVKINCPCGRDVQFYSESGKVCECGRAYRVEAFAFCNDEHVGDPEYWIKQAEADDIKRYNEILQSIKDKL